MSDHKRMNNIDFLKLFAVYAVICIHTQPFKYSFECYGLEYFDYIYKLIRSATRFAVPCFFIISGYFFSASIGRNKNIKFVCKKYVSRLVPICLFWNAFYFLYPKDFVENTVKYDFLRAGYWHFLNLEKIFRSPLGLVFQGVGGHLWFIVSLMIAVVIITIFVSYRCSKYLFPLGVLFYMYVVAEKAYFQSVSFYDLGFDSRGGPFVSLLFVYTGFFVEQKFEKISKYAKQLLCVGLFLLLVENSCLFYYYGYSFDNEYLLGFVPFCVGIFLLAMKYPQMSDKNIIAKMGSATLGIYVMHIFVKESLEIFKYQIMPVIWDIIFPIITLILCYMLTLFMRKVKLFKKFV